MKQVNWTFAQQLSVRNALLIIGISSLSILCAFWMLVLQPRLTSIQTLQQQYEQERQKVRIVEQFIAAHPSPDVYLRDLDTELQKNNLALPDSPDVGQIILQLEELSHKNGVVLQSLKPAAITPKDTYREIPLEVKIHGGFPQIMQFIQDIEAANRFTSVTGMSVQNSKQVAILDCRLTLILYAYGAPTPTSPPVQKKP